MKNEIEFSHVTINKVVKNRKYVAEFTCESGVMKNVETTIAGSSPEECLQKTESFLGLKLSPLQYTINN